MLSEFEAIERTYGVEKAADLRKALHFLLRRQFVFAGDPRTGTVYNVIMDGRFRSVIDGFFDSCGYRVHRDAEAQWAGITALGEDVPLPRMKLDETIVILVLAAHWQDEVNVGRRRRSGHRRNHAEHAVRPLQGYGAVERIKFDISAHGFAKS